MGIPVPKPKYALGGDLSSAITTISNSLIILAGSVALLFLLISALRMVTSASNREVIEKSKAGIMYAIIGLVIIICAYLMISFIVNNLA